ncbi:MAG TPA: hypothetical protein VMJ30_00675 [Gemmatimonadales bacterium]|nr:hypothetical protein [Gemmatimonadales bacterium]
MPCRGSKWRRWAGAALIVGLQGPVLLAAQERWNTPEALALAERARDRRLVDRPDTGLDAYHARASGFVLFLGQLGAEPPRLVKADQLAVEVYWRSPGQSKQIIKAWRDGRWLPTDIRYHRDHLGIVTNDFGPRIVIGEGDEVRNVPHPLSAEGRERYDFALGESVTLATGQSRITVRALEVRPRDPSLPGVVGTLFVDTTTAAVVRFRFGFTPASYLDAQLADITVELENALLEGRWWLPVRQIIEIRRRVSWLDFPATSIIRGRWEIGDYEFNPAIPPGLFVGPAIGGLRQPAESSGTWDRPLTEEVLSEAPPVGSDDLTRLRGEVARVAGGHLLERVRPARLGLDGVSDLIHVNRVEGLTLGMGLAFGSGPLTLKPRLAYATDADLVTGGLRLERRWEGSITTLEASRSVTDFSDIPAASRLINSFSAQEWGDDFGDYLRLDRVSLEHQLAIGQRGGLTTEVGYEESRSLETVAVPARSEYRANPALGAGSFGVLRLSLRRSAAPDLSRDWSGELGYEGGAGDAGYSRVKIALSGRLPAGPGVLAASFFGGAGTSALPVWRSFALGGRATLPGEDFRTWGGRTAALVRLDWRFTFAGPPLPLGPWAESSRGMTISPFVAAGWAGNAVVGAPWQPSPGVRPVAGVAVDFLLQLLRVEAGVSLRTGAVGLSFDFRPDWWPIL